MNNSSANVSLLQQMLLLKDSALSVVSGPTTDGVVWPNMVTNMLLRQVIASERYTKAIVVAFDRSADDLRLSLAGAGDGSSSSISSSIGTGNSNNSNNSNNKLDIIEASGALFGAQTVDSVLSQVRAYMEAAAAAARSDACNEEAGDGDADDDDNVPAVAILVSSCSALELAVGNVCTMAFLRAVMQMLSAGASASGISKPIRGVLLGVVHERLHQPWQLAASYRAASNAFCTCVPNEGQLSPVVALEVHTVRRTAAGKVQEAHELFSLPSERGMNEWAPAQLKALPQRKDHASGGSSSSSYMPESTSTTSEVENVFGDLGLTSSEEVPSAEKCALDAAKEKQALESKKAAQQQQQQQQRLITFASTDPEFDEDSDPDADLDL